MSVSRFPFSETEHHTNRNHKTGTSQWENGIIEKAKKKERYAPNCESSPCVGFDVTWEFDDLFAWFLGPFSLYKAYAYASRNQTRYHNLTNYQVDRKQSSHRWKLYRMWAHMHNRGALGGDRIQPHCVVNHANGGHTRSTDISSNVSMVATCYKYEYLHMEFWNIFLDSRTSQPSQSKNSAHRAWGHYHVREDVIHP